MKMQFPVWKAVSELGLSQLVWYVWYQAKLKTGLVRWQTRGKGHPADAANPPSGRLFPLPEIQAYNKTLDPTSEVLLFQEAEEILEGKIRIFGGPPQPIDWHIPATFQHWTVFKENELQDIKFVWEPARMGWACTLARAYFASQNERYAQGFWKIFDSFLEAAPPYQGPHWISAQEAAIRILALGFAWQIFQHSSHSGISRACRLGQTIAEHARRIPPTLAYARAQNNNHLLVEAAGLWTAGLLLPQHPCSPPWKKTGWQWLCWALNHQIETDGTYIQHSTNYHRVMLQTVLWCFQLACEHGQLFSEMIHQKLASAARWLNHLCDPYTGRVPNLGPNDGAYILPLTTLPFSDFRPVIQAAMQAFVGERPLEAGPWDEMSLWLVPQKSPLSSNIKTFLIQRGSIHPPASQISPHVLRSRNRQSWAYLRVAHFKSRPGHADQLHLDLWWKGINLAQDAGSFQYNAQPPWDNALTHTAVHNTLLINGREQMQRVGRFLYLDWAQGRVTNQEFSEDGALYRITAQHDGYRNMGIVHCRTVETALGIWRIEDIVKPNQKGKSTLQTSARLHWLLPDVSWNLKHAKNPITLQLFFTQGTINLWITALQPLQKPGGTITTKLAIYRAGECILGTEPSMPTWGWVSPCYGVRVPALAIVYQVDGLLPLTLISEWQLPAG